MAMCSVDNTIKCHCGEPFGSAYHYVHLCVYGSETHIICAKCITNSRITTKRARPICAKHKLAKLIPFTHFWRQLYHHSSHAQNSFAKKNLSSTLTVSVGNGRSFVSRKSFQLDILTGVVEFDFGIPISVEITFGKVDSLTISSCSEAFELKQSFRNITPGKFTIDTTSFPKRLYLVLTHIDYVITT